MYDIVINIVGGECAIDAILGKPILHHVDEVIGLAGCSADCDSMRQIGIDVLPEYRRKGIAAALTSQLAVEIIKREKVPFYCCAWCNLASARNAVKSGFRPAWTEIDVRKSDNLA